MKKHPRVGKYRYRWEKKQYTGADEKNIEWCKYASVDEKMYWRIKTISADKKYIKCGKNDVDIKKHRNVWNTGADEEKNIAWC